MSERCELSWFLFGFGTILYFLSAWSGSVMCLGMLGSADMIKLSASAAFCFLGVGKLAGLS